MFGFQSNAERSSWVDGEVDFLQCNYCAHDSLNCQSLSQRGTQRNVGVKRVSSLGMVLCTLSPKPHAFVWREFLNLAYRYDIVP